MKSTTVAVLLGGTALAALDVNVKDTCNISKARAGFFKTAPLTDSTGSIKDAAKLVAGNLLSYYNDQDGKYKITGLLPGPPTDDRGDYFWWESGAMWDTLISYWHATGDDQYNDLIAEGLLWQTGDNNDFLPVNFTASMSNDDQGFWAMAAMSAAEYGLPNEKAKEGQQWLEMASKVCNEYIVRWGGLSDEDYTCGGGLRWQIPSLNIGYDYKNSISTGVFFNLAARLAKATGNSTYADWADKTWEWMQTIGFMDEDYNIFDGAHAGQNCTDINKAQFSYTAGVFLQGAAAMYNQSNGSDVWKTRTMGLLNRTTTVFLNTDSGVPVEITCETMKQGCNTDMRAFKGILLRGMESASDLVLLSALFESTGEAVAKTCNEETGACGFVWTGAGDDGMRGAGEQMNALSAFTVLLSAQAVSSSESVNKTCAVGAGSSGPATGTGAQAGKGSETGSGTVASGSASGTPPPTSPSGAALNGACLGSVLGGLLLVAAFFA